MTNKGSRTIQPYGELTEVYSEVKGARFQPMFWDNDDTMRELMNKPACMNHEQLGRVIMTFIAVIALILAPIAVLMNSKRLAQSRFRFVEGGFLYAEC